jgi:hypothetical protein
MSSVGAEVFCVFVYAHCAAVYARRELVKCLQQRNNAHLSISALHKNTRQISLSFATVIIKTLLVSRSTILAGINT